MKTLIKISWIICVLLATTSTFVSAQTGTSCSNPYIIFPATDCSNVCGTQYCGDMPCPTGDCSAYITMSGSAGGLNPSCTSDNETTQNVMWMAVTATTTSFTIENLKVYVGAGAASANTKDYIVYSGTCGNLSQIACYTLVGNATATVSGLTAGQIYYVMASAASTNTTADAISACITSTVAYAAPGNTCATANSLSTNVTYTYNNAGATASGPICSGSVENDVWYKWCAPAGWPMGQQAYLSVYDQVCNSTQGLQLSVWNTNSVCPSSAASATVVCQNPGALTQYYYNWTASANQCYFITLDGFAGTACQYKITIGSIIALPIDLVSFEAMLKNDDIEINWTTATEQNNEYFTLEKSADGINFIPLQKIPGAGNSSEIRNYSFTDEHPFYGINYYRLKQTDYDGHFTYSDISGVNNKFHGIGFSVYPSVYDRSIDIAYPANFTEATRIRILDINGRTVYETSLDTQEGMNTWHLNPGPLTKGLYFVILENSVEQLMGRFRTEQ